MSAPTHTIKLKPFMVPNFVVPERPAGSRGAGLQESLPIALAELSVETLEQLCAQFRAEVMRKAGKSADEQRALASERLAVWRGQRPVSKRETAAYLTGFVDAQQYGIDMLVGGV